MTCTPITSPLPKEKVPNRTRLFRRRETAQGRDDLAKRVAEGVLPALPGWPTHPLWSDDSAALGEATEARSELQDEYERLETRRLSERHTDT